MSKLINIKEVTELVGLSKSTLYRKIENGGFPPPKRLGGKTVRWLLSDVEAWVDSLPSALEVVDY